MDILMSLFYYFKECLGIFYIKSFYVSGNFDMFYLVAVYIFLVYFIKKKGLLKKSIFYIMPIAIYSIIQLLIIKDLSILKLFVNLAKIYLCLILFVYIKDEKIHVNIKKIIKYISILFTISIPIALIFKKSFLWRQNDYFNLYSKQRLNLFYLEPSELGFQVSIIILFLVFLFLSTKNKKEKIEYALYCLANIVILYFAAPFGSIILVLFAVFILITIYLIKNLRRKDFIKLYSVFLILIAITVTFAVKQKNPIYLRVLDTINSKDPSNNYRVNVAFNVTGAALEKTSGLGVGFGNLNTKRTQKIYAKEGLQNVIVDSFMYFVTEGGVFAIIFLAIIFIILLKYAIQKKCELRWGLFSFIMLYQVFGGHFTNTMNWIIYGFICSNIDLKKMSLYNKRGN